MNNSLNSIERDDEESNQLSDELDMLSYIKKFSLEKKKNSFKEQLLIDEEELKLKLCGNFRDKDLDYKLSESSTTSIGNDLKIKASMNKQSSSTCDYSEDTTLNIAKSISQEEVIIKSIILGDKQVGKTLFRNIFLGENTERGVGLFPQPTTTLDIKKKQLKVSIDSIVRLEMVDTNIQIQSSPIIQSKFYRLKYKPIISFVANSFSYVMLIILNQFSLCRSKLKK